MYHIIPTNVLRVISIFISLILILSLITVQYINAVCIDLNTTAASFCASTLCPSGTCSYQISSAYTSTIQQSQDQAALALTQNIQECIFYRSNNYACHKYFPRCVDVNTTTGTTESIYKICYATCMSAPDPSIHRCDYYDPAYFSYECTNTQYYADQSNTQQCESLSSGNNGNDTSKIIVIAVISSVLGFLGFCLLVYTLYKIVSHYVFSRQLKKEQEDQDLKDVQHLQSLDERYEANKFKRQQKAAAEQEKKERKKQLKQKKKSGKVANSDDNNTAIGTAPQQQTVTVAIPDMPPEWEDAIVLPPDHTHMTNGGETTVR